MPIDIVTLTQALSAFGSVGANIVVVVLFLKYMEKRDELAEHCAGALSELAQAAAVSREKKCGACPYERTNPAS